MHINPDRYTRSQIPTTLKLFTGFIRDTLKHATPAELVRTQDAISLILWRFHYTVFPAMSDTPLSHIRMLQKKEKWPAGGQFIPRADLPIHKVQDSLIPDLSVKLEIDYLTLEELPFFVDVRNVRENQPLSTADSRYRKDVLDFTSAVITKPSSDPINISYDYFLYHVIALRQNIEAIKMAWPRVDWLEYWCKIFVSLSRAGLKGITVDSIMDKIILRVRNTYPGYALRPCELTNLKPYEYPDRIREWQDLVSGLISHILLPFSWYLPFTELVFTDVELFHKDMEAYLSGVKAENSLYAPSSHVVLSPVGRKFIKFITTARS